MRRFWLRGLCVWAGYFAGSASGQETVDWRPVSPRPLAIARTEGTPLGRPAGVRLGRPQPLDAPPAEPSGVIPTSFRAVSDAQPPPLLLTQTSADLSALPPPAAVATTMAPLPPGLETVFASDIPRPLSAAGPVVVTGPLGEGMPGELSDGATAPPAYSWHSALSAQGRVYLTGEYLLWWSKGFNTPPLATTSPATVPQAIVSPGSPNGVIPVQGVLGFNTTSVLFGGSPTSFNPQSGFRIFAGYWLDCDHTCAIEIGGFSLGQATDRFSADSLANPVIARPFTGVTPTGSQQTAELVASPGNNAGDAFSAQGNIHIDAPTQLWGIEANARHLLCCGCDYRVDLLAGFRFLHLDEGLHITEDLVSLRAVPSAGINVGDRIVVTDNFDTRNNFYGGQLGISGEWRHNSWFVSGTFKLALGDMQQVVDIHGTTSINPTVAGVAPRFFNSGLLALDSNSGTFTHNAFAVVPEVTLKVGYQVTEHLRAFVGYNFLYASSVVRPGDQIDTTLDENKIPPGTTAVPAGTPRPMVLFKTSDYWAQGVTFGLEWRY